MPLLRDAGHGAMSGINNGLVGKLHDLAAQRVHDVVHRAAPEIGASDTPGEERVSSEELRRRSCDRARILGEVKTNTSGCMTRRVDDASFERAPAQGVPLFQQLIDFRQIRRGYAKESGLDVHRLIEWQVVAVHQDGSAGKLVELGEPSDVIDVRVRADNRLDGEPVPAKHVEDSGNFIARINDQRLARHGIAYDRAVALQQAHGNRDSNQALAGRVESWKGVAHSAYHSIQSSRYLRPGTVPSLRTLINWYAKE